MDRLTLILQEEARTPVPHPCIALAYSSHLPDTVWQVASTFWRHETVIRAAVWAYSALIDGDEDILGNEGFARCLMNLTELVSGPNATMDISPDTEAAMVELRFEVAAKIRLQPEILPAWFKLKPAASRRFIAAESKHPPPARSSAGSPCKDEFPLFYSLMAYVHYESPIGDFARTGLLYIIETASNVSELEHWMIESDLATLMASGLGALYSQLSRLSRPCSTRALYGS